MDQRIAAELLYESEATLRMVDDALQELRIADPEQRMPGTGRQTLRASVESDDPLLYAVPSELCIRAFWQIQELLDGVRQSRETLQALGGDSEVAPASGEEASIDRALSLLDRLDTADASAECEASKIHGELRRELLGMMNRAERRSGNNERISTVTLQLSEAEARLTRLAHVFETGED